MLSMRNERCSKAQRQVTGITQETCVISASTGSKDMEEPLQEFLQHGLWKENSSMEGSRCGGLFGGNLEHFATEDVYMGCVLDHVQHYP